MTYKSVASDGVDVGGRVGGLAFRIFVSMLAFAGCISSGGYVTQAIQVADAGSTGGSFPPRGSGGSQSGGGGSSVKGSGGSTNSGGSTGSGGSASTGGATSPEGGPSSGGSVGSGGRSSSGGTIGSGGAASTLCGNGRIDTGEDCEGTTLNGKTCGSLGFSGGVLACAASCLFNTSACSSTGSTTPKINITASRTVCSAPCGVFFDATTSSGLQDNDYVSANFNWDFDSTNVNPTGAHRQTIGFATAHVFDVPGTYQVSVRVQDLAGRAASTMIPITVSTMTGTTYYLAARGSDSNTGTSMDKPLLTLRAALSHAATNVAILARRGDTFMMGTDEYDLDVAGPFLLSAYTDPAAPSTAAPILSSATNGNILVLGFHSGQDMRLTDLHIISTNQAGQGIWNDSANNLVERVEIEGVGISAGGSLTFNINPVSDPSFFVDCHAHDFVGYGLWGNKPKHFAMIGSTIERYTGQDHGIRIQGGRSTGTIIDPGIAGPSYFAENTVAPLPITGPTASFDSTAFRGDDTDIVYVNNVATSIISFTPQNLQVTEHISNVLVEGNTLHSYISLRAQHVVIRDNVFVDPDPVVANPNPVIDVEGHPLLPTNYVDQIFVYNNTAYIFPPSGASTSDAIHFLQHLTTTGSVTIRNNIFVNGYTNNRSSYVTSDGMGTEIEDHNLGFAPDVSGTWMGAPAGTGDLVGDPKFVSTDITNPKAFRLSSGSPGIGTGATTSAYQDFSGVTRRVGAGWDMGAYQLTQ